MYYLKCNNCGHLNEVKSEYLTFCSSCNKKLENNYSDWIKRNHDKSLDDFKKLICISESDIKNLENVPKPKKRTLKYWIGFAVAFAIFSAIGQFGGEAIVDFFKSEKTSKEVLTQEWISEVYGSYGLSVETPEKLIKSDLPIADNVRQVIDQMDVYEYMSNDGFKIVINSIKYNPAIGQTNLQGAANGSITEMKMQKGVSDLVYTEEHIEKNSIPGFIQKGSYDFNGIEVEFVNLGFAKDLLLWHVIVLFQSADEVGRIAANRVIESVEISEK